MADLDRSVTFYEKVFNAQELVKLTHKDANGNVYAKVLQIPGFRPMVELWVSAASAHLLLEIGDLKIVGESGL